MLKQRQLSEHLAELILLREVLTDKGKGETTSGVFSPSLKQSIAIARVPKDFDGDTAKVLMRGKEVDVRVLKLPFVRNGQKQFD